MQDNIFNTILCSLTNKRRTKIFDIKKNDPAKIAESGYEFTVELPDGTVTDWKIKVRGANSPKVRNFEREVFNQGQIRRAQNKKRGKTEEESLSIEEVEDFGVRNAKARVISWTGLTEDGTEVPSTPENIERILTTYAFVRDLVVEESTNAYNFRHDLNKSDNSVL